jgi:hypothetical protein
MARSSSWSVKGVDKDARQFSRESAKRHGMTIGEWVDRAIKTRAENSEPTTPIDTPSEVDTAQASSATAPVPTIDEQPTTKPQDDGAPAGSAGISFNVEQALKTARGETKETSPIDIVEGNAGTELPRAKTTTVIAASSTSKISHYSRVGLLSSAIVVALVGGVWIYDNNLNPISSNPQQHAAKKSKPAAPVTKSVVKTTVPRTSPVTTETTKAAAPETRVVAVTRQPLPAGSATDELGSLRRLANTGDHKAQFELANRYLSGKGVTKDPKQAVTWLKKAANGGVAPAQYNLGLLYEMGSSVKQSPSTALDWYHKAADQEHARARHNLGTLYAQGKGTPKDYKNAARWFKKGPKTGSPIQCIASA